MQVQKQTTLEISVQRKVATVPVTDCVKRPTAINDNSTCPPITPPVISRRANTYERVDVRDISVFFPKYRTDHTVHISKEGSRFKHSSNPQLAKYILVGLEKNSSKRIRQENISSSTLNF
jgi:hypothetical protein